MDDSSEDMDFQSSFSDFPHLTDSVDLLDSEASTLESSFFEDQRHPSIPQFGATSLFNDQPDFSRGFLLSGPRSAAAPHKASFSFQTTSSSSSSFSSDVDGRIHEQVIQEKTQRGGNGHASKSISASRLCVDGDCNMKTVESTAPAPGVEFVEGVSMRGPRGGALDKHMSLMLGMGDGLLKQNKKSSMEESDAFADENSSEKVVHSRKADALRASHMDPTWQDPPEDSSGDLTGGYYNSSATSRMDHAIKSAHHQVGDTPAASDIIMFSSPLMPSDEDVKTSKEEGHSEPDDEDM